MRRIKTVSVFAGSSCGNDPVFGEEMFKLGTYLGVQGYEVRIGGYVGMMKCVADGILEESGHVYVYQPPHYGSTAHFPNSIHVVPVNTNDDRKKAFFEADAWISGPGSAGMLSETFEALGINLDRTYQNKPVIPHFLLNVSDYFKSVEDLLRKPVDCAFGKPETLQLFKFKTNAAAVIEGLLALETQAPTFIHRVSSVAPSGP